MASDPSRVVCPLDAFTVGMEQTVSLYEQARRLAAQGRELQALSAIDKAELAAKLREAEQQAARARAERWWFAGGGALVTTLVLGMVVVSK